MKKYLLGLVFAALSLFGMAAHAVIDVSAVTTGITDAGVAIAAIIAGLLALSVSLFGLVKVYRFVSKKAGA